MQGVIPKHRWEFYFVTFRSHFGHVLKFIPYLSGFFSPLSAQITVTKVSPWPEKQMFDSEYDFDLNNSVIYEDML